MNHPEVTEQALRILRSGEPFQWYVITLLAMDPLLMMPLLHPWLLIGCLPLLYRSHLFFYNLGTVGARKRRLPRL